MYFTDDICVTMLLKLNKLGLDTYSYRSSRPVTQLRKIKYCDILPED